MPLAPHIAVKDLTLPNSPAAAQDSVNTVGGIGFPRMGYIVERISLHHLRHHVHMVRHHTPSQKSIALSVEMPEVTLNERSNLGLPKPACPVTFIKIGLNLSYAPQFINLLSPQCLVIRIKHTPWQGVT